MVAASMFKKLWKKGAASGGGGGKASSERSSSGSYDSVDSSKVAPLPVLSPNLDSLAEEKAKGAPLLKKAGVSGADVRRIRKKLTVETTETVDLWDLMHGLEEDEDTDNWVGKHSPGGPLPDLNVSPNRQEITDLVRSALKNVLDPKRGKDFEKGKGGKDFVENVLPLSEVLPLSRQSPRSSVKSPAGSSDGGFRSREHSFDGGFNAASTGTERRSSGGSVKSLSPRGLPVSRDQVPSPDAGKQSVRTSSLPASKSTGNLMELEFASPSGPVSPATLRRHFTFPPEGAGERAHGRKAMSLNGFGDNGEGSLLLKEGFSGELSGKALGLPRIKVRGEVSKTRDDISVRSGDPWRSLGASASRGDGKSASIDVSHLQGLRPARLIEKVARRGNENSVSRAAEHLMAILRKGRVEQVAELTPAAATSVQGVAERQRDPISVSGGVVEGSALVGHERERGPEEQRFLHKGVTRHKIEQVEQRGLESQPTLRPEDIADLDEIATLRRISAEVSDEIIKVPDDEIRRRRDMREAEDAVSDASFAFNVRFPLDDDVFGSPISAAGPLFDPEMLASFEEDLQTMSEEEWQAQRASGVGGRVSVLGRRPSGGLETTSGVGEMGSSLWGAVGDKKQETAGVSGVQSRQERSSMGGEERFASGTSGRGQVLTGGLSREASMDDGGLDEVMSEVEDFLSRLEQSAGSSWERGVQEGLSAGGKKGAPGVAPGKEGVEDGLGRTSQVPGPSQNGSPLTGHSPKGSPRGRALGKPPLSPRRTPKNSPPVSPGKSTPRLQVPRGDDRIVVYTTSVRAVRKTFENCNRVRGVFSGHGIHVDERDISMHSEFREELRTLMGGLSQVPQVFVRGEHIGGLEEVQRLNDSRELLPLLEGFDRHKRRVSCDSCGGVRFHLCHTCNGSCKLASASNPDGSVRCPDCNENGLRMCTVCA